MAYVRKTIDEYEVQGLYEGSFECVVTEDTFKEARAQLKCYRENETGTTFRIVKKRVRKEPGQQ